MARPTGPSRPRAPQRDALTLPPWRGPVRAGAWVWRPRFGLGRAQALRDGDARARVRFLRLLQARYFDTTVARRVGPGVVPVMVPVVVPAVALPRP